MSVLITGATGFVGSCLARRLVEEKYEVHVFTRHKSDRWRIADLSGRLRSHQVDLRDAGLVEKAVDRIRPAVICHLATHGGFAHQKDTTVILEANLTGTVNLLKACEKIKFHCFVNTGSSSEYGVKPGPMTESDLLEPVGDYGLSKAAATLFCRSRALERGLPVVTLRLFSPYGPWDDPLRLIPHVIKSLRRGEPPRLCTPAAVRDYIYIDDVLEAFLKVIKAPPAGGAVFNIGSGRQRTVGEVVSVIRQITGSKIEPVWGKEPPPGPQPNCWRADIGKAARELGWRPSTSLRAGLARTVAWLTKNLALYP
jgi:nucleoside-diphosphate-sugar epimerase